MKSGARQKLDKHSFVLLFAGLFYGLASVPGGAEEFKAGLNAPNDSGSLYNGSPDSIAQARSRFFDGFHGASQNLIDMDELQTQAEYVCTEILKRREANVPLRRQARLFEWIPGAEAFRVDAGHDAVVANPREFVPQLVRAVASAVTRTR